ncbi:dihydroxyacetone kinase subunit DhaL [Paraoerskovia marina]|uniref:dihydroxyacetone kinase subunit DhaL n=1 Tax=Paraoerskovia marina TaxID=545619 RepID=UPI0004923681|nr:dihydroxyacetone kinase subunit DhaL [Paraoerskovia marina]
MLDVSWAVRWVRLTAEAVGLAKAELTELDRRIGDGDHGENLDRGYRAVVERLDALDPEPENVGDVLKLIATTLMSKVGGASGPLYGTAYLRAAKATAVPSLDASAVVALVEGALDGVTARGKAVPGEKTMVDAWQAAADAAAAAAHEGASAEEVLRRASTAATAGAASTTSMVATKGRASYLGDRSAGSADPGATSTALILDAAVRAVGEGR